MRIQSVGGAPGEAPVECRRVRRCAGFSGIRRGIMGLVASASAGPREMPCERGQRL
jgi:hypothetical protein